MTSKLPQPNPETKRYWDAAAEGQLLFRYCLSCKTEFCYPRTICPDCFSTNVEWREAEGTGTVYSFSYQSQSSGDSQTPSNIVAYIELAEGIRMISNIVDAHPEEIEIGMNVQVEFFAIDNQIHLPVFSIIN